MASGGAFGGARGMQPKAPERGVFPLDHFGECKKDMQQYMDCLKKNGDRSVECRDISKRYLECRMKKRLMMEEDLKKLGFTGEEGKGKGSWWNPFSKGKKKEAPSPPAAAATESPKESQGFLAGLPSRRAEVVNK